MGTRSLTFVYDGLAVVVCMYRQMDGYPSGHGADLAEFLQDRRVVNGIGSEVTSKYSNGMGCLAASMVAEFKDGIGGIYLYPSCTTDAGQDYEYHIFKDRVKVMGYEGEEFNGTWKQFKEWCKS